MRPAATLKGPPVAEKGPMVCRCGDARAPYSICWMPTKMPVSLVAAGAAPVSSCGRLSASQDTCTPCCQHKQDTQCMPIASESAMQTANDHPEDTSVYLFWTYLEIAQA